MIDDVPLEIIERHHQLKWQIIDKAKEDGLQQQDLTDDYIDECDRLAWEFYIPDAVNDYHNRKAELVAQGVPQVRAQRLAWDQATRMYSARVSTAYDEKRLVIEARKRNEFYGFIDDEYYTPESAALTFWESQLVEDGMGYWERRYFMEDKMTEMAEAVGERERDEWLVERRKELRKTGLHENRAAYQALCELYDLPYFKRDEAEREAKNREEVEQKLIAEQSRRH